MIFHATAENAEDVARLLRTRGRIVITAPPRCGKTTELIRYAEERFPNGRFAIVARPEDHPYIIKLHWRISNGISHVDVVAKRLLGQELEGEDCNPPSLLTPEATTYCVFSPSTPVFCDCWFSLTEAQRRAIMKRRLFIAAVTTLKGEPHAKESQDR
jgi:hypothetical protein